MAEENWQGLYKLGKLTMYRNAEIGCDAYCYSFLSEAERDQFRESRQGVASLQHANISQMNELACYTQGFFYILTLKTELCQATLEDEVAIRLSEGRLWSPKEVIAILRDMLAALQYAESQVGPP
jgi:hypothetical protein